MTEPQRRSGPVTNGPKESPEVRLLRVEHAAAVTRAGSLLASKGPVSIEFLEAKKARAEAWDKLRDALGLSIEFRK